MRGRIVLAVFFATMLNVRSARADVFTFWVAANVLNSGGSSDVFEVLDSPVAGGLALGFEVFYVDLFVEAFILAQDQYLFTANLGFDMSFGEDFRFHVGLTTGPIFFLFPEATKPPPLDLGKLTANERAILDEAAADAGLGSAEAIADRFNAEADLLDELERYAIGWNVARLRLAADVKLASFFAIGIVGQVGYHFLLTGEQAAAGAKNAAIDNLVEDTEISEDAVTVVRNAVGARKVEPKDLDGVNYTAGIYMMFEF